MTDITLTIETSATGYEAADRRDDLVALLRLGRVRPSILTNGTDAVLADLGTATLGGAILALSGSGYRLEAPQQPIRMTVLAQGAAVYIDRCCGEPLPDIDHYEHRATGEPLHAMACRNCGTVLADLSWGGETV